MAIINFLRVAQAFISQLTDWPKATARRPHRRRGTASPGAGQVGRSEGYVTPASTDPDQPRSAGGGLKNDDIDMLVPARTRRHRSPAAARRADGPAPAREPLLAVLFDSDGVLVDSRRVVERHWRRWAAQHQLDVGAVLAECHGQRTADVVRRLAPHLDAERTAAGFDEMEGRDVQGLSAYEAARWLLGELDDSYWGVVTSGGRALVAHRWAAVGLPVPAVLVTGEEVSRGKPSPEGYLLGARRLSVAPESCVAIEDAPAGVAAAKEAGMTTLAITTTHDRSELARADLTMPSLRDAARWLHANLAAESWK